MNIKIASILSISIFSAASFVSAQISMSGVEIIGNMYVSDNPSTSTADGNLFVETNTYIGGLLNVPKITSRGILMGDYTSIQSGQLGIALGVYAQVTGNGSLAVGYYAHAKGNSSLAVGSNAFSKGGSSVAIGGGAQSNGDSSLAVGVNSQANKGSSIALGTGVRADGDFTLAIGYSSKAIGDGSFAGGVNGEANGKTSFAFGKNVKAQSFSQITLGHLNKNFDNVSTTEWVLTDPLFVLGNGPAGGDASNALVILKNGNATLSGIFEAEQIRTKTVAGLPMGDFGRP
jgi:Hep_Hag.